MRLQEEMLSSLYDTRWRKGNFALLHLQDNKFPKYSLKIFTQHQLLPV
jgi:hypothetical protein